MDGSVAEEKSSFKMLGLSFSSNLDWGSYFISITKTASKKIGAVIHCMKFLSPEVALYLYKSTIRAYMEYCCHVWAGAPSCYLELLDKLQKRMFRTVDPSLAASLEPLAHRRNVVSWSLFCRYCFGIGSSEPAQLVLISYSWGGLLVILMVFRSSFLDVTIMSTWTVSFVAQLGSGILCL